MRHQIRRMCHKDWWIAHQQQLPTNLEILSTLLAILLVIGGWYVINAHTVMDASVDALVQNERILNCLNNKGSLGTVHEGGFDWDVGCQIMLHKRS